MVLFLLLSKQVIEQYLLWPLPFLVLLAAGRALPRGVAADRRD